MSKMTAVSATVMPVEISSAASPSPADVNTFRIRNAVRETDTEWRGPVRLMANNNAAPSEYVGCAALVYAPGPSNPQHRLVCKGSPKVR